MSWTKREFIVAAFEEIGIGSYQFDLQPEMLELARKRLDAMLMEWNALGIRLGYPSASTSTSGDIDDDTSVPDSANMAIFKNLAISLAPVFGKQVSPGLRSSATKAYNALIAKNTTIPEVQYDRSIPAGEGNKLRRVYSPFLPPNEDKIGDAGGYLDIE